MTCIVGMVDTKDGSIWMGGDSAGVGGLSLSLRNDEKVFINGPCIMGFTSSFRMGQLLRYKLVVPARKEGQGVFSYMVTDFIDAVRACLKEGGYAEKEKEKEIGGTFLVGYAGRLFCVQGDYQVAEEMAGYDACGCGEDIAKGAMYALEDDDDNPQNKIHTALAAAARYSAGVSSPFYVYQLKG